MRCLMKSMELGGPDHDHGQGNGSGNGGDEDGYTMDFGPKMLEEEAEESTPGSTQTKSKRRLQAKGGCAGDELGQT